MLKEDNYEKLRILDEKIRSLYKGLVQLRPAIPQSMFQSPLGTNFALDPDDQAAYRQRVLDNISQTPQIKPIPSYRSILENEYKVKKISSISLIEILKKFINEEIESLKILKLRVLNISQEKKKKTDFHEELEQVLEMFAESNECLGKINQTNDNNLGSALVISDIIKIIQRKINNFRILYPCLEIYYSLEWLHLSSRSRIYKKFALSLKSLKNKSITRMKLLTSDPTIGKANVKVKIVTNINARNLQRQREIMKKVHAQHSTFAEEQYGVNTEILNSHLSDFDLPPVLISSSLQLNTILKDICDEFGLISSLNEDDGHTITHQITYLFPEIFDIQKHKSEWIPYDDPNAKDMQKKKFQKLPNKITKNFVNVRKKTIVNEEENQSKVIYKIVCIKDADWKSDINPEIFEWEKVQESRLRSILKSDALLENSFNILSIQNFNAQIKLLEEFSVIYQEKSSKKGRLRSDFGESQNEVKQKYLKGLLSEKTSSHMTENESINLSAHNLKSVYTLKLLKSREIKFKIIQILNVFKCYERSLNNDLIEIQNVKINTFDKIKPSKKDDIVENIENEFYVKDAKDEYIVYDATFEEYAKLEDWLLHLGTFYIEKHELILDHNSNQYPPIDREFLMAELLEEEYKFLFSKLQIVTKLMRIYNGIIFSETCVKLAEIIVRVMRMRPRINLTNSYFTQSYWAHCEAIKSQSIFLTTFSNRFFKKNLKLNIPVCRILKMLNQIQRVIEDLCLDLQITCPKEISLIESVVWDECDLKIIDSHGLEITKEKTIDWDVYNNAIRISMEDVIKGKIINEEGEKVSYTDICLNITEFFMNYKKILKKNLKLSVLEEIYSNQLLQSQRAASNPINPLTPATLKLTSSFKIFELLPDLSQIINFKSESSMIRLITGSSTKLFELIQRYEIWNLHLTQTAIQVNSILTEKYSKNIIDLEIALEESFIMKSSKLNWIMILGRKGEGIIIEKVQQEIKRFKTKIQCSPGFVDIPQIKIKQREKIPDDKKNDFFLVISLFCDEIQAEFLKKAQICQILKILKEIWKMVSLVPEKMIEALLAKGSKKSVFNINHLNINTLSYLENHLISILNNPEHISLDLNSLFSQILSFERYFQFQILIKLLNSNKVDVIELYELSTITKPVDPEEPDDSLPDEVKSNKEIKKLVELFSDIISLKIKDWTSELKRLFYLLSNSIYELKDKLLAESNETEIKILQKLARDIFGFTPPSRLSINLVNSIIIICEQFRFDHKEERKNMIGGFSPIFSMGLVDLSDQCREFIFNSYQKLINSNSTLSLELIENKLKTQLLKSLFIEYKALQSNFTTRYVDCLQLYDDYLEDIKDTTENTSLRMEALKFFIIEKICEFGIKSLESLYDNYNPRLTIPSNSYFSCNFDHIEIDSTSKIGSMQNFSISIRNKCSRVETIANGYAMVLYVKDLTLAIRKLMNGFLSYNESHFFGQLECLKFQIEFLNKQLVNTETAAKYFSAEAEKIMKSFDGIVNMTVTQRGSEIIYELDSIRRQLKEIQENTRVLESYTRIIVDSEFRERLETRDREIQDIMQNFKSFQDEVAQNLKNGLESNISNGIQAIIPYSSKLKRQKIKSIFDDTKESVKERRTKEKKVLQSQMTLLRIFSKWAIVHQKEKIDKEISKLKQQLTSNQIIWEELNHSQRRETILKQELANSQTVLSASEKNIEKLQKDIEVINTERLRLQVFKDNKLKQTEILENLLKQEKESKDKQVLLKQMLNNNSTIRDLHHNEFEAAAEYLPTLESYESELKHLKSELSFIRSAKDEAYERLESIRKEVENRGQKVNWKEKFNNLSRIMTNSTSRSFIYSSSRTPIKLNDSYNYLSLKSKSPTLPKISDRGSYRIL